MAVHDRTRLTSPLASSELTRKETGRTQDPLHALGGGKLLIGSLLGILVAMHALRVALVGDHPLHNHLVCPLARANATPHKALPRQRRICPMNTE